MIRLAMRKRVIGLFFAQGSLGICPICAMDFEKEEEIVDLPCHITHQLHKDCFNTYRDFKVKNKVKVGCPVCRTEVDMTKVMDMKLPEEVDAG